jgi:hypothetical protein
VSELASSPINTAAAPDERERGGLVRAPIGEESRTADSAEGE